MKAQTQLTKISRLLGFSLFSLMVLGFENIQPLGFDRLFHKDLQEFVSARFNPAESEFMGDQEELFQSLLQEIERHPELLNELPAEIQAEIKSWKLQGKDLI